MTKVDVFVDKLKRFLAEFGDDSDRSMVREAEIELKEAVYELIK